MRTPSRLTGSHLGGARTLTILLLALVIGSAGPTSLARAAGSSSIGIWLQAERVGPIRTICVGDSVQFRLRVVKSVGVEGQLGLRVLAGINIAASVAGSAGVGSISPPSSYTGVDSVPPGTTGFSFKAQKPGTATIDFTARVNQVWFLGYEVSANTVRTQVQLKVEDCKFRVTATTRWSSSDSDYTAIIPEVLLTPAGGDRYEGSGTWTYVITNIHRGCEPHVAIFEAPVQITGDLDGTQLTVDVSYEASNGVEPLYGSDCDTPHSVLTHIDIPEPLTFTVPGWGGSLSMSSQTLVWPGIEIFNIPGGTARVSVTPVSAFSPR